MDEKIEEIFKDVIFDQRNSNFALKKMKEAIKQLIKGAEKKALKELIGEIKFIYSVCDSSQKGDIKSYLKEVIDKVKGDKTK